MVARSARCYLPTLYLPMVSYLVRDLLPSAPPQGFNAFGGVDTLRELEVGLH